jgi:hypothetical protein
MRPNTGGSAPRAGRERRLPWRACSGVVSLAGGGGGSRTLRRGVGAAAASRPSCQAQICSPSRGRGGRRRVAEAVRGVRVALATPSTDRRGSRSRASAAMNRVAAGTCPPPASPASWTTAARAARARVARRAAPAATPDRSAAPAHSRWVARDDLRPARRSSSGVGVLPES